MEMEILWEERVKLKSIRSLRRYNKGKRIYKKIKRNYRYYDNFYPRWIIGTNNLPLDIICLKPILWYWIKVLSYSILNYWTQNSKSNRSRRYSEPNFGSIKNKLSKEDYKEFWNNEKEID